MSSDKSKRHTLLSKLRCTDPNADAPSYALVEIKPEEARKLLSLYTLSRHHTVALKEADLAMNSFAVSYGSNLGYFQAFESNQAMGSILDLDPSDFVLLSDEQASDPDFTRTIIDSSLITSVECFRVEVSDDAVVFTAIPRKCGDYELRTGRLPINMVVELCRDAA